jgi:spore germination protein KB
MLEKGKISARQMGMIMFPVIVATGDLLVPAITAKHAEQDMWISPILGSITGFLVVFIVYQLNKSYPQQTIIQYSGQIIGKIPGKVIGLLFLLFLLHVNGLIIRQYGEFVVGNFLVNTPLHFIISTIMFICAFVVRAGLEVLARTAEVIVPLVILLWIIICALLIGEMDVNHMFPIMDQGIMPALKGAITPMSWFTHFVLISFCLPFVTDRKKGMKSGMISVIVVMVILFMLNITTLLVFGGLSATLTYPVMSAVRYISLADFLEHLESLIMALWVSSAFIKISAYYYALVLGTAQWLNLSDYRSIVFPLGLLLVLFSFWSLPNLQEMNHLFRLVPFNNMTFEMVIPILLFLIHIIRRKRGEVKANNTESI